MSRGQRRQMQAQHRQAEEQILAERAFLDGFFEVAVAGGDQPDVDPDRPRAADPIDLAFLDRPQQFGLKADVHLADLVEQQRAAVRLLELPDATRRGPGERTLLVTEQFRFEQILRNGGAIDRDEGAPGAAAVRVQVAGHHFLAGAALAGDQHARIGRRILPGEGEHLDGRRIVEDRTLVVLRHRLEHGGDQLGVRWQRHELLGAGANGRDRRTGVAVDTVGDHRQVDALLQQCADRPGDVLLDLEQHQIGARPPAQRVHRLTDRREMTDPGAARGGDAAGFGHLVAASTDDDHLHADPPVRSRRPPALRLETAHFMRIPPTGRAPRAGC